MLVTLDGHDAHGGNCLENAFGKVTEAAILLKGDFRIGVVGNETIFLFKVRLVSGGTVRKVFVGSFEE